jgi:hypothetical protein
MSKNNINYNLESSPVGLGLRKIAQVVKFADFTDGGAAVGTLTMKDKIPAGAFIVGTKVTVKNAFSGNTSCVLKVGKTSGEDEFVDGATINIFTTGAKGESPEDPLEYIASEQTVYLQATSNSDWGLVSTAGKMLVEIFYLSTEIELLNPGVDKLNW